MKVTKVCVIGDLHDAPGIPKERLRWLGKHIKNTKPDQVVLVGILIMQLCKQEKIKVLL
jgi:hypothetical protein